ncbi:MAG: SixA phosphatase family protein [Nocardioides sp.]
MTRQRRLIVMRHAKAEPFASTDHARALTDRGRADAASAGEHLVATGAVPDHALVSSAIRTVQTWEVVAEAAGASVAPVVDDECYHGGPDRVLEALQASPEEARTVLFVGHNPTASYLCHLLDDGDGDQEALRGLLRGFPTSALAVFEVEVPWSDLAYESGRLVDFYAG